MDIEQVQEQQENLQEQQVETQEQETQEQEAPQVDTRTPEEIEASIKNAFSGKEEDVQEEEPVKQVEQQQQKETQETGEYKPLNPVWNTIQKEWEEQFGEGTFKMPEGVTAENENEALLDFLTKSIQPDIDLENIPPAAREIIELHKQGVYDEEKWLQERKSVTDIISLPDDDFLFTLYKADGHEDEDIRDHLDKMTKLEKTSLAKQLRGQYKEQLEEQKQVRKQFTQEQAQKHIEKLNEEKINTATKIINVNKDRTEFLGVPMSKAQIDAFHKDFPEWTKINPQTGTSKLYDALQSDQLLYEFAAILHAGGGNIIKNKIQEAKKEVKDSIENKLGVRADLKAEANETTSPQTFNLKKFKGEE